MANFSFTVDTQEMAATVHEVAPHVDGTTAAVVAMQAAVIAAEKRAADHVCDNVNRGFYGLIRSQISQKVATIRSQIEARLLELRDQSLKLLSVKGSMERDFEMITARYTKLFNSLNNALFSRVRELDQAPVDLVQKDLKRIRQRCDSFQASLPLHQLESIRASQFIAASATKADAVRAIGAMNTFIADSMKQNLLTASILGSGAIHASGNFGVPVIFVEVQSGTPDVRSWNQHAPVSPNVEFTEKVRESAATTLRNSEAIDWQPVDDQTRKQVAHYFDNFLQKSSVSERVKKQAKLLFASNRWAKIGGEKA